MKSNKKRQKLKRKIMMHGHVIKHEGGCMQDTGAERRGPSRLPSSISTALNRTNSSIYS